MSAKANEGDESRSCIYLVESTCKYDVTYVIASDELKGPFCFVFFDQDASMD